MGGHALTEFGKECWEKRAGLSSFFTLKEQTPGIMAPFLYVFFELFQFTGPSHESSLHVHFCAVSLTMICC